MAETLNFDEMKAEFLSFAIEAYKTKLGVSGAKIAEYFDETGTQVRHRFSQNTRQPENARITRMVRAAANLLLMQNKSEHDRRMV